MDSVNVKSDYVGKDTKLILTMDENDIVSSIKDKYLIKGSVSKECTIGNSIKIILTLDEDDLVNSIREKMDNENRVSNRTSDKYVSGIARVAYFPSVNSMYMIHRRRKVLSRDALDIRLKAQSQLSRYSDRSGIPNDGSLLYIEMGFYLNHSIAARDLDNMFKFIIDTLSEFYSFNDNRIYEIYAYKRELLDSKDSELLYYKIGKCKVPRDKMAISMNEVVINYNGVI